MDVNDQKLVDLLNVVIDNYIDKWDPVWSKFLHSLEWMDYAPSTLRKYLNLLEKAGMVYQPYNSSGRVPTLQWLETYIDNIITHSDRDLSVRHVELQEEYARNNLRYLVETLGNLVDGVVVWFLQNDEYYFLGVNNLLRKDLMSEYETTKQIIDFIEKKKIVPFLATKMMKQNQIYYTFLQDEKAVISTLYTRITVDDFDGVISILWPMRVNYKKNLSVLKKFVSLLDNHEK